MSRPASLAFQRYQKAISLWPRDKVRPGVQMQDAIQKRVEQTFGGKVAMPDEAAELRQASALLTLLNDGYQKKYPLRATLKPKSNPAYFENLLAELDRMPDKTYAAKLWERISGFIRLR